ncbi:hypothetical protein [Streptomyces nigra]|uniref:hypothetical protein n=1 Tax=Streptomyces nigra TaxID=1827580 RepID=UPI0036AA82E1
MSALVNLTVGMLTQKWNWAWLACSIVLVVLGVALQMWLTKTDGLPQRRQVFEDVEGKSLQQRMKGAGDQRVTRAKVEGSLRQTQDD